MLRVTVAGGRLLAARASQPAARALRPSPQIVYQKQRWFADDKKTSDQPVLPGSHSDAVSDVPPVPKIDPTPHGAQSSSSVLAPQNVQTMQPTPRDNAKTSSPSSIPPTGTGTSSTGAASTAAPSGPAATATPTPAAPAAPTPKPKKKRRIRRFFYYLAALIVLFYGGGTYYSTISDGFHDFFTEFIPLGETLVSYVEEREFQRRFADSHHKHNVSRLQPQVTGENKVTFSGRSGVSAKNVEESKKDSTSKGAAPAAKNASKGDAAPKTAVKEVGKAKQSPAEKASVDKAGDEKSQPAQAKPPAPKDDPTASKPSPAAPAAAATSTTQSIPLIDKLGVENATDPVVQNITKMLNDIISVVNNDGTSNKFSSAFDKAKDELKKLAGEIETYRASESQKADEKIKSIEQQFDQGAQDLLARLRQEQQEQELRWREEYEAERERLSKSYQEKLHAEIEAAQKVAEQKRKNELMEQDIALRDQFATTVREQVESERSARLSKLNELEASVWDLASLTTKWNSVVDSNLATQHLVVAVEAVRSVLEGADRPTPFLHELAALKEVADGDAVVNAAIASIHPSCYQKGVPTSAQLIDRFRRVAAEVRKAALLPEDAGVMSHVASVFLSKVMFKKDGAIEGEDVESVLTRTEMLLEEGELDQAAREMNSLGGWAKVLSKDWIGEVRRVLEVRQALDVMATEARLQSLMLQ